METTTIKRGFAGALLAGSLALSGVGLAFADGADGGNFRCDMSGVPGWGTVSSHYNHPSKDHWATAVGRGRETVNKPAGQEAIASVGRAFSGNKCYYGTR